jgi:hypothetical protein
MTRSTLIGTAPAVVSATILIAAATFAPAPVTAQSVASITAASALKAPSATAIPRTPWGDPDIQGTWTTDETIGVPVQRPVELGTKRFFTDEDLAERARRAQQAAPAAGPAVNPPDHWAESASGPVRQTSFVVDPPDGRIPATTPAGQQRAAGRDTGSFGAGPFNSPDDLTNFDRCISRGVVGSMMPRPYGNGLDIVQAPGYVAIRHEMIHEARVIPVDGRPHLSPGIRQYMGDSRGRWEGATLVVETSNLTDRTSIGFNGNGLRHSGAMTLVERFTRVDAKTIAYEVLIADPKTYTRPFTIALPITMQPGYQVFEFACHEGNYGMRNILSAARAGDK